MVAKQLRILLSLLLVTALGCTTAKAITGPDGTENQLISCSIIENCYEKATEICSGPYKIVNTSSETSGSGGYTSTATKLLVKCGR